MTATTTDSADLVADVVNALEVGGTHVTSGRVRLAGPASSVEEVRRTRLDSGAPAQDIVTCWAAAARHLGREPTRLWAAALPGPMDYVSGVGAFRGVGKFDALRGVDVRHELTRAIGIPAASLTLVNDAEAFLIGEWVCGQAVGSARCVALTLGTGIGSAFLRDGAIVRDGPDVPPDGHLYRLTIGGVPLEDVASGRALLRDYRQRSSGPVCPSVRQLTEQARHGDRLARAVLADAFTALGRALGRWIERFDPSVVVVGGAMVAAWDVISGPLNTGVVDSGGSPGLFRCSVAPEQSALIGAAHATGAGGRGAGRP